MIQNLDNNYDRRLTNTILNYGTEPISSAQVFNDDFEGAIMVYIFDE